MKSFVLILMICALQGAQSTNNTQAAADDSNDESIYPGKYPSHVVIKLTNKTALVCEGVIFSKNLVLTAAGCAQKYKSSPTELEVVAGIISTENIQSDKNAQTRKVINITIHQDWYNSKQESGDIAILKVSPSFNINKYVNVSAYGAQLFTNDSIRVVGYGESDDLISHKLRVPPAKECYYSDGSSTNNTEKFCAKINRDGYEETFWDKSFAGAPILLDDSNKDLAGVMSVNYNAITYVEHYSEWIESITGVSKTKNNRVQSNSSNSISSTTTTPTSSPSSTTTTVPTGTTISSTSASASFESTSTATTTESAASTTSSPSSTTTAVSTGTTISNTTSDTTTAEATTTSVASTTSSSNGTKTESTSTTASFESTSTTTTTESAASTTSSPSSTTTAVSTGTTISNTTSDTTTAEATTTSFESTTSPSNGTTTTVSNETGGDDEDEDEEEDDDDDDDDDDGSKP
ncbi:uncharacterized protein DDB_G0271670-like [Planococcus citri]|uniref:uncharacterized protein DDB_G0271670-like n=1 Tax=Planococcus citri TaxID=170843 RepID=UPI0031FA2DFA